MNLLKVWLKSMSYNEKIEKKKIKLRSSKFILGDAIEELEKIDDNSIDLAFCDPPYNLQLSKKLYRPDMSYVSGVKEDWDKFASFKEYDTFTMSWLKNIKRVLKNDGALWVIGSYHNLYRIGFFMQNLGFWFLNDIVWTKTNPMPNFRGTRFTNAHETLIWASKFKDSKYTFNYRTMKKLNNDKQMRSDWNLKICNGKERIKDTKNQKLHSTQKPEQLLERVILSTTKPGEMVLDPFFGTGTTGAVCKKLGRKFIGIEKDANYLHFAKKRIMDVEEDKSFNTGYFLEERYKKRIPFASLIQKGLIKAGKSLYNVDKNIKAQVMSDGSLKFKKKIGSIHKIGALAQNRLSCNGWDYWYVNVNKKLISINEHRDYLRSDKTDKE